MANEHESSRQLWLAKLSETRMASRRGVNDETGSRKPRDAVA